MGRRARPLRAVALAVALAGWAPGARAAAQRAAPGGLPAVAADAAHPRHPSLARVLTNTAHVQDLAAVRDSLWVASRGGLERYDLETGALTRRLSTLDGLPSNDVRALAALADGHLEARTLGARCVVRSDTITCRPAHEPFEPTITPAAHLGGHRVTRELRLGGVRYVGTAGDGVHRLGTDGSDVRLTPHGQICSNHVTDLVEHGGALYAGSFAEGLCVQAQDGSFEEVDAPFRMINDLESTPFGLFVGANDGLFRARDGRRFERVFERAVGQGVTGLAFDGASLWVTTPGALHRLKLARRAPPSRSFWRPGGARAVQDLALGPDGAVWLVTEDSGAVRFDPSDASARLFDRAAGLPTSWAYAVDTDGGGTAYVGTLRHGLVAIAPDGRHASIALPDAWLLRVRREAETLLVGTQGGAFAVHASGRVEQIADVPDPRVHEVRTVRGELWVGTEGGTLVRPAPVASL